ncbi:MAG: hypothetical protein V1773_00880 [bacterium]
MLNNFEQEKKMLDEIYSEMIEAILNKPETDDYELSRIYFENAAARMNKWAEYVNKVKSLLEKREPTKDLSADNRPA